ncbi:uncharacterized protein PGTG_22564 [Puccinia graminis f. sp. tritici CRL 75-36-700-3]|uniref:Uncharacterized protein n=1 Tax=Puccinia graminis f. sp. tritici (strain CRL 75-36-700-3 / race SCCL) TaxID=418459 RepID=H6QUZ8_PUCGT|nr:uncharacterized protein PGTG_22564 [Puccinia graminis f. sp. tritici CRL 75-36-700-3]EHS62611.1 hypothetical protein PGTG_22564 [Puccinia graminis f. sp. tritici CRL 75-36-700-3]
MGFATKTFKSAVKHLKSYMISNNIKKEYFASSSDQATMMTKANTSNSISFRVTNWCTLPNGTHMNANNISHNCLRGM